MNIEPPEPRYASGDAVTELAAYFQLPWDIDDQDWSYQVADPDSIEEYLTYYDELSDNDKKFVLMEMIIQATADQREVNYFLGYWLETKKRLLRDFALHEYTIYYWACFDNDNLEDCFVITPYMRELWFKQKHE